MLKENLLQIYAQSFRDNWDLPALTDYSSDVTMTYRDLARHIARGHILLELSGIKRGDKVALMGKNSVEWIVAYMTVLTYGAVIVPVLHDFSTADAQHIIHHSESKLLLIDESIWRNGMELDRMPRIRAAVTLGTPFSILAQLAQQFARAVESTTREFQRHYPEGYTPNDIVYPELPPESLAEINYTSGTTGFSKGVMLPLNSLCGNVVFGIESKLHRRGTRALSFLPLAHAYGCAFDMLVPLAVGTHITVLGRLPSPAVILAAMAKVRPNLVICVPLILEKIYRRKIQPMLAKPSVRRLTAIPGVRRVVYNKIRDQLIKAFGGEFEEVIVGGAPLNAEVEAFLHRIRFPFTVGYGMTECGPLISYTPWRQFIPTSSGRTLPGLMHSKVDGSSDPERIPGEICVRGENVMQGYYRNPEATAAVLDPDGWLHTGDMGTISPDGTIFIKGRYKTMILSATGQNIYPEEIEAKLNNMPFVAESLIVERGKGLTALVYPDYEALDAHGISQEKLPKLMEKLMADLNSRVAAYERIQHIQLVPNEFEKTPKRSIKRFLYS